MLNISTASIARFAFTLIALTVISGLALNHAGHDLLTPIYSSLSGTVGPWASSMIVLGLGSGLLSPRLFPRVPLIATSRLVATSVVVLLAVAVVCLGSNLLALF
jgi:hypothetical protein